MTYASCFSDFYLYFEEDLIYYTCIHTILKDSRTGSWSDFTLLFISVFLLVAITWVPFMLGS